MIVGLQFTAVVLHRVLQAVQSSGSDPFEYRDQGIQLKHSIRCCQVRGCPALFGSVTVLVVVQLRKIDRLLKADKSKMEVAWRFRIIFAMAFAVIIFGDLLGYGGAKKDPKDKSLLSGLSTGFGSVSGHMDGTARSSRENEIASADRETPLAPRSYASGSSHSDSGNGKSSGSQSADLATHKEQLKNSLREACLPKLLCEMAAKPNYSLNVRERDLLSLIRSTTLSLTMAVSPTKWHFAAHMGQLLRDAGDSLVTPMGCSHLWPSCPYSSKKLLKLTNVVQLK